MATLSRSFNPKIAALLGVAILSSPTLFATPLSLFNHFEKSNPYNLSIEYYNANDAVALKDALEYNWYKGYSPREGSNIAIINHRIELGMRYDEWYFGYALRYDMFIDTNKETTDILKLINTKSDLPLDRVYKVDIEAYGIATHNLIASRRFKLNSQWNLFVGGAVIYAFGTQDGFVDAYANIISKKEYDFEGYSQYYYDKNHLYELDVERPNAYGYSLNFGIEYHSNNHTFRLLVEDFASYIFWKDLAYSEIFITSNTKEYDEHGYIKYNPSITGYEFSKEYTQKLQTKFLVQYAYQFTPKLTTNLALGYYNDYLLPFVGIKYEQNEKLNYSLGYEGRFNQLTFAFEYQNFKASLATNSIKNPTALSLNLTYSF